MYFYIALNITIIFSIPIVIKKKQYIELKVCSHNSKCNSPKH